MKIIVTIQRKPGMTSAAFRDHYERSHVALAHKYLGHLFTDYRRNYVLQEDEDGTPSPSNSDATCDVVTEIWLRDEAAWTEFRQILADPEIGAIFREDETHFMLQSQLTVFPVEEVRSPAEVLGAAIAT
ncbi:EthD domain-containing protein [Sphingopyxis sp. 22461]|uniref:EthD domain-containing protein n=1 Tax=Sphingopyxis sp. 22461 TaxID=3453923 RepID=UPI003F8542C9